MPTRRRFTTLAAGLLAGCALPRGRDGAASLDDRYPPGSRAIPGLATRRVASRDGTRLHVVTGGAGPVTLAFVHGWSCNHRFFWHQLGACVADYRCVALDLAGHGDSALRQGPVTVEAFVDDLEAALGVAGDGPMVLVVHSTGGRVACAATRRLGDRLLGIVGVDTFQNLALPPPPEAVIEARLAAQRADFVGDTRRYVDSFFPAGADPALREWVAREMTRTDPAAAIAATAAYSRFDARAVVAGWPRPVRALNADLFPADAAGIRAVLPRFELTLLPGRSHFPQLDDPPAFNALLAGALASIAGAARAG